MQKVLLCCFPTVFTYCCFTLVATRVVSRLVRCRCVFSKRAALTWLSIVDVRQQQTLTSAGGEHGLSTDAHRGQLVTSAFLNLDLDRSSGGGAAEGDHTDTTNSSTTNERQPDERLPLQVHGMFGLPPDYNCFARVYVAVRVKPNQPRRDRLPLVRSRLACVQA